MTNCYFSKMAAIIYPTHVFCNMTVLLSRWCRAYFSTPSNPDSPMAALREHRVILLQAQPSTTQVVSTLSKHQLLGNISPVNHHIWQDDYFEMTMEKPWRTTDPYGAREQRHQKCRQRSHHRSGSSRSSLCHM